MPRWTEESRRQQAETIKKHKPWKNSTGPRSAAGKERSRLNALKHGLEGRNGEAIRQILFHNREFTRHILLVAETECLQREAFFRNELIKNRLKTRGITPTPGEIPGTDC
jgi:hypothetical protein